MNFITQLIRVKKEAINRTSTERFGFYLRNTPEQ